MGEHAEGANLQDVEHASVASPAPTGKGHDQVVQIADPFYASAVLTLVETAQ